MLKGFRTKLVELVNNDHTRLQKMLQEKIEESRKQLVHCIDAELVKMQYNLEHQQKQSEKASEHTVGTESVAACPEGVYTGFAAGTTSGQHHVAVNEPAKINVQAEEQELEENCSDDLGEKREAMVPPLRRYHREKRPKNMSPWVVTQAAKRQRKKDEADDDDIKAFYNIIDKTCTSAEANA